MEHPYKYAEMQSKAPSSLLALYAGLHSAVYGLVRRHCPRGSPCHTITTLILSLCIAENLLSILNLLRMLGIASNPHPLLPWGTSIRLLEISLVVAVEITAIFGSITLRSNALTLAPSPQCCCTARRYFLASQLMLLLSCGLGFTAAGSLAAGQWLSAD